MSCEQSDESELFRNYALPLIIFLLLSLPLVFGEGLQWDHPSAPWWQRDISLVIYPLQTIICGGYIWMRRKRIPWDWEWRSCLIGAALGIPGIGIWLIPYLLGWVDASTGFDPGRIFGDQGSAYYLQYILRFLRAVVVVAVVEEFFWRGWLMRYCIKPEAPQSVPIGSPSWIGYLVTCGGFMIIHRPQDYAGALIFGSIAYALCVYTRRISPVICYHAVANLIMGIFAIALNLPGLW